MDAASRTQLARGVTYGKLTESHPDRIVVEDIDVLYLAERTTCIYPLGTRLKVIYSERELRKLVEKIMRDQGLGLDLRRPTQVGQ